MTPTESPKAFLERMEKKDAGKNTIFVGWYDWPKMLKLARTGLESKARIAELKRALRPFAEYLDDDDRWEGSADNTPLILNMALIFESDDPIHFTVGQFREAKALLGGEEG